MALLYGAAGIIHFTDPGFYLNIIPGWLPAHQLLLNLSGIAEIILGLLLLPRQTRPLAAWLIIAMLVVFLLLIHPDDARLLAEQYARFVVNYSPYTAAVPAHLVGLAVYQTAGSRASGA